MGAVPVAVFCIGTWRAYNGKKYSVAAGGRDDERGARVSLGLDQRLHGLREVRAHRDRGHVDVAITTSLSFGSRICFWVVGRGILRVPW